MPAVKTPSRARTTAQTPARPRPRSRTRSAAPTQARGRTVAETQARAVPVQPEWPAPGSILAPEQRAKLSKTARELVPREDHAQLALAPDRDPVDLLELQGRARLPELVPVRYGRMLASPFAYYRGAALPMAWDLASTPVTDLKVQACGDAHMANFGVFGTPERRLVFDINDFDETLPGPWEWDVKRLAASLEVAARENGFAKKDRRKVVLAAVGRYRDAMQGFAGMTNMDVWYSHADLDVLRVELESALTARMRKAVTKGLAKARTRDSMQALDKLTRSVDGQPRIISDPPLVVPLSELAAERGEQAAQIEPLLRNLLVAYRRTLREDSAKLLGRYVLADIARKVVGVGSVGTR